MSKHEDRSISHFDKLSVTKWLTTISLFAVVVLNNCVSAQEVNVIPLPQSYTASTDTFFFKKITAVGTEDPRTLNEVFYLEEILKKMYGMEVLAIAPRGTKMTDGGAHVWITLNTSFSSDEAYRLEVSKKKILLTARHPTGIFYGIQTLLQSVQKDKKDNWYVRGGKIQDAPRFSWRGMHLDVSRHFFPKDFIKKYIDLLALHKMNVFHWHLTDDQGWRIEIRKYPKLTSTGGWRKGSMVGHYSEHRIDTVRYGGYYTQEDIREIVRYAQDRHITIVPEIEMPGHSMAALAAYPELSCTGGPFETAKEWGVFDDVYCAGNEKTFAFMQEVLDEVCELFPGKYIHIGGDECPKTRWKTCAKCQQRIKDEKLKDEHELQSYFIQRMEKYLNAKGRQIIGWDEILEGGLAPNAAVMSWRGTEGGIAAAKEKHQVVMTPGNHCYFDHYQGDPQYEPVAIGGYTTVQKVYSYEPVPAELTNAEGAYVLGAQGNVWTEYILYPDNVEYMALPRMSALAEVLWTPKEKKNEKDFMERLKGHFEYLGRFGANYSASAIAAQTRMVRTATGIGVEITPSVLSTKTSYRIKPNVAKHLFSPIPIAVKDTVIALTQSGKVEIVSELVLPNTVLKRMQSIEVEISASTGKNITYKTPPHVKYNQNADVTLVDGVRGAVGHRNGGWLAWSGEDVEMTIDLGKKQKVKAVHVGSLEHRDSWIYAPVTVEVRVSSDNEKFKTTKTLNADAISKNLRDIALGFKKKKARYIRVVIKNPGKIPAGQPGEGQNSWMFFDEVWVE